MSDDLENKIRELVLMVNNLLSAEKYHKFAINYYLKEALSLGAHKSFIPINLDKGLTVNVSEYITNLCNKYEILIPED